MPVKTYQEKIDVAIAESKKEIEYLEKNIKLYEDIKKLDLTQKAESGKIYSYIPECQFGYHKPQVLQYKPVLVDKKDNHWMLLCKDGNWWYGMRNGKVYKKKDPTLKDFETHYRRRGY